MNTLRAAIYTRVSRDASKEMRSVSEQEAECRVWVDAEGWSLVGVWSDNDRSASQYAKRARDNWEALLDEIRAGNIDIVVVWEPARATRDRIVWAHFAALCEEQHVKIGASGRVYDLDEPEDAFQLDLFFALAAREPKIIRKRVGRSRRAGVAAGSPTGPIPYGYRREYKMVPSKGAVLLGQFPDEQLRTALSTACFIPQASITLTSYSRAEVLRDIAARLLRGESGVSVAQRLNRLGVPPPGHGEVWGWNPSSVRRMVRNPAYAGMRVDRGEVTGPGTWEALLTDEVYYGLMAKLSDPERKTYRDGSLKHPLTGMLSCGRCGGPLSSYGPRDDLMYACVVSRRLPGEKKFHVGRKANRMHELVKGLIALRLSQPDAIEAFMTDDREAARLKEMLGEVAQLRQRHRDHAQLAAKGQLSAMALAVVEQELLPQIKTLETRIRQVRLAPLAEDLIRPEPEEVAKAWERLRPEQQREVFRVMFTRITVHPMGRGRYQSGDLLTGIEVHWRRPSEGQPALVPAEPADAPVRVFAKEIPASGRFQAAGQVFRLPAYSGRTLTVRIDDQEVRVLDGDEEVASKPRS